MGIEKKKIFPPLQVVKGLAKKLFKKIHDNYSEQWLAAINSSEGVSRGSGNKLRTYCKFKDKFTLENYLLCLPPAKRRALTKLRISSHKLEIERGRYRRPTIVPAAERFCKLCNSGEVEDEFHFLAKCELYKEERQAFLEKLSSFTT